MDVTKTLIKTAFSFCLLIVSGHAFSQSLKGQITDAATAEPLAGATVSIEELGQHKLARLDGRFTFQHLRAGKYTVKVSYEGYQASTTSVDVTAGDGKEIALSLQVVTKELSVVTITGGSKYDQGARNWERRADPLVNVLSAKTIQLLPDITVANVMQRISGVTIERNSSGEARYPIIRGMEKRYINTLINGIKIPSPDNKSRFIPLDLFPSELLERLEVSKSLTPSMEGDAIGGTINLVMKDAPLNRVLQVNVSGGYNNAFGKQDYLQFDKSTINKKSPAELNGNNYAATPADFPIGHLNYTKKSRPINTAFGITAGNRFGKDKKLGVLFSGSYQNIYSGTSSTFFVPNAQPNLDNMPQFVVLYNRQYSTQNQRVGLNAKIDYKINDRNKIALFNTFVRLDMFQVRQSFDTIALNTLVDETFRTTWQYQSIYNSTLQGLHQVTPTFTIDWSAGYSIANNHIPDQATYGHEFPVLTLNHVAFRGTPDYLNSMSRNWMHNSDKDLYGYLNFTKQLSIFQRAFELKVGGMIRDKKRENFYNTYTLGPLLPSNSPIQTYTDINAAQFTFKGGNATPGLNGNNYDFREDIWAGYVQGKLQLSRKWQLLGGLRTEGTHQDYTTELGPEVAARSGKIWYTDLLPSAQLKYALKDNQSFRLSYYKALARPQFAELIPEGPDNFETFKERGNPEGLNHAVADNIDLRYEFFPGAANQILIGAFYKTIKDPIELTAIKVGVTSQNLEPKNIGTATNYGFEAVFTKYFGPIGISANYTFTKSSVTNDSMLYSFRNSSGVVTSKYISETRPLQGQSNHVGNVSVLFKSYKLGIDAQVAFVYTGERISLLSPYAGLHYWQQPTTGLDASFEVRIVRRVSFYGKVNNITNSPIVVSLHVPYDTYVAAGGSRLLSLQTKSDKQTIVQKDYIKTSFLAGVRFKL